MAPVSDADKKSKSRFSLKSPKKQKAEKNSDKTSPDGGDNSSSLLKPESSGRKDSVESASRSPSLNRSNLEIGTPETAKKGSKLNMSFRKKKKGNICWKLVYCGFFLLK